MKLSIADVRRYRSIVEGATVSLDEGVTYLVGRNGVGKTALLQALHTARPARPASTPGFDPAVDYPLSRTWELAGTTGPAEVARLVYRLEPLDVEALVAALGPRAPAATTLEVRHHYGAEPERWRLGPGLAVDAPDVSGFRAPRPDRGRVETSGSLQTRVLDDRPAGAPPATANGGWDPEVERMAVDVLRDRLPRFVLAGGFDTMAADTRLTGSTVVHGASSRGREALDGLLALAGAQPSWADDADARNQLSHGLEVVSAPLTRDVARCWPEFSRLSVEFEFERADSRGPVVHVFVRDSRSGARVSFEEAPRGFSWLFTLLARVTPLEADGPVVLLLDEPAPTLDGAAQVDLRHFLGERFTPHHQVLVATASGHVAGPGRLGARAVENRGGGTFVSSDVGAADPRSVLPLSAAGSPGLSSTAFSSDHLLLVGDVSDSLYLQVLSSALSIRGRRGLDSRWSVVPVGAGGRWPALLGVLADVPAAVCLVDDRSAAGLLPRRGADGRTAVPERTVAVADVLCRNGAADVEDLFSPTVYVELVNSAYRPLLRSRPLSAEELPPAPRVVRRVELALRRRRAGARIDRLAPAQAMLRQSHTLAPTFEGRTEDLAEDLFDRINGWLA